MPVTGLPGSPVAVCFSGDGAKTTNFSSTKASKHLGTGSKLRLGFCADPVYQASGLQGRRPRLLNALHWPAAHAGSEIAS